MNIIWQQLDNGMLSIQHLLLRVLQLGSRLCSRLPLGLELLQVLAAVDLHICSAKCVSDVATFTKDGLKETRLA